MKGRTLSAVHNQDAYLNGSIAITQTINTSPHISAFSSCVGQLVQRHCCPYNLPENLLPFPRQQSFCPLVQSRGASNLVDRNPGPEEAQLRRSIRNMGRARRKFRRAPQNTQRLVIAVAGSVGQEPAGNVPQTVADPPAQTLEPHNTNEEEVELEGILRARSLFDELTLRAGDGKLVTKTKFSHHDEYEEEFDLCFEELAQLAGNCIKDIREEHTAAKAAWQDKTKSPTLRMEARLHGTKLMLSVPLETVDFGLCMIQLFNVPKTFCWTMFGYNQVRIARAARHGIKLKEDLTGALVQTKDDPVTKAAGNAKKNTEKRAPRKPNLDHLTALLAEYHRNVTELLKDVQAVNNSIGEEDIGVPHLPELSTILDQGVVVDLPEHVIQTISDLVFLLDEMHVTRPDVTAQRDTVLKSLKAWRAVDKDFWEYAKKNLHENPVVAKYEYSRRSFLALFILWRREESKAFDYAEEHGLVEKLEPGLRRRLGWLPHRKDREEEEKDWQLHLERLNKALPSAEELVTEYEENYARSTMGTQAYVTAQHGDWWKVLVS